jgi:ketosteroid isomerase-like protein
MKHLVLALTMVLAASPAFAASPPGTREQSTGEPASLVQAKADTASERAAVERTIHDNICWALTKDRALAERTMAHDADLFIFNPTSTPTVGWDELVKNFAIWMDPRFKAVACDIGELRVSVSRSGDVAWWSAMLDDLAEWDGKPTGWKDTRWTGVLEKRDGAWVIVQMHFSFAADKVKAEALAGVKK